MAELESKKDRLAKEGNELDVQIKNTEKSISGFGKIVPGKRKEFNLLLNKLELLEETRNAKFDEYLALLEKIAVLRRIIIIQMSDLYTSYKDGVNKCREPL